MFTCTAFGEGFGAWRDISDMLTTLLLSIIVQAKRISSWTSLSVFHPNAMQFAPMHNMLVCLFLTEEATVGRLHCAHVVALQILQVESRAPALVMPLSLK